MVFYVQMRIETILCNVQAFIQYLCSKIGSKSSRFQPLSSFRPMQWAFSRLEASPYMAVSSVNG
jgi:hypothetical protein